jgi:hypothetical protein
MAAVLAAVFNCRQLLFLFGLGLEISGYTGHSVGFQLFHLARYFQEFFKQ